MAGGFHEGDLSELSASQRSWRGDLVQLSCTRPAALLAGSTSCHLHQNTGLPAASALLDRVFLVIQWTGSRLCHLLH